MSDRPEYRTLYIGLADDVDAHAMTPAAFKLFIMLKLTLPVTGLGIVYPSKLCDQVGVDRAQLDAAFAELETPKPGRDRGWILRDRNVVWIVNAFACEPGLVPTNKNHIKYVRRLVASVDNRSFVTSEFKNFYPQWFQEDKKPIRKGSTIPSGNPSVRDGESHADPTATDAQRQRKHNGHDKSGAEISARGDGDAPDAAAAPLFSSTNLPADVVAFGARFYRTASPERKRDVLAQLVRLANGESLEYRGASVRAGSVDRLIAACRAVQRVHDTNLAIAVLLTKLGDTSDLSAAEVERDRADRLADERQTANDFDQASVWLGTHPELEREINAKLDADGYATDGVWAVGRSMARRGHVLNAWRAAITAEVAHA